MQFMYVCITQHMVQHPAHIQKVLETQCLALSATELALVKNIFKAV